MIPLLHPLQIGPKPQPDGEGDEDEAYTGPSDDATHPGEGVTRRIRVDEGASKPLNLRPEIRQKSGRAAGWTTPSSRLEEAQNIQPS